MMPMKPLWSVLVETDRRLEETDRTVDTLLSVSKDKGVVRYNELFPDRAVRAENHDRYKFVESGSIVLNKMSASTGAVGVANEDGIVSPDYAVFVARSDNNPKFLNYILGSTDFCKNKVAPILRGIGTGDATSVRTPRVGVREYLSLSIPVPSPAIQQRIADYLDRETAEIDAAVADLDKYVELLEKRRRIIIVDGFNDPTYDPIVQRLKFLTVSEDHRRIPIKSGDRVAMAGEYPYYGASGIIDYVNDYLWDNEKRLLLSEDGANLVMRNHPVAFVADGQYWVNNHAHVLKCVGDTSPELVALAIEVTSIAHLITGSAQPKLTAAAMGEISFMFPHSAAKQDALLKKLKPELDEIDSLIAESTKLRDLLLKRRSVLITEVVTGRKQV